MMLVKELPVPVGLGVVVAKVKFPSFPNSNYDRPVRKQPSIYRANAAYPLKFLRRIKGDVSLVSKGPSSGVTSHKLSA